MDQKVFHVILLAVKLLIIKGCSTTITLFFLQGLVILLAGGDSGDSDSTALSRKTASPVVSFL